MPNIDNLSNTKQESMPARPRLIPLPQNSRLRHTLNIELNKLHWLLEKETPTDQYLGLTTQAAEVYENRRNAISIAIKTAKQFCIEVNNFNPNNPLQKPEDQNNEILYLTCICTRVYAAIKFLSNKNNAHQYNHHYSEYEVVKDADILKPNPLEHECETLDYDINYHQQNVQEIQKMISHLSGHRWESVRNTAFALAAALVIASIALGFTVGTGGVMVPVLLGGATLSAGIGFFAAKDSGIAKSVRQLELNAL